MVLYVIMFHCLCKTNAIQVRLYLYRVVELFLPIYGIQTCLAKLYNPGVLSKPFEHPAAAMQFMPSPLARAPHKRIEQQQLAGVYASCGAKNTQATSKRHLRD